MVENEDDALAEPVAFATVVFFAALPVVSAFVALEEVVFVFIVVLAFIVVFAFTEVFALADALDAATVKFGSEMLARPPPMEIEPSYSLPLHSASDRSLEE